MRALAALGLALGAAAPAYAQDTAAIAVKPDYLDFGTVKRAQEKSFVVRNTGTLPLMVTDLIMAADGFRVVKPATPIQIEAGGNARVTVAFDPYGRSGSYGGSLSVFSTDMAVTELQIGLQAEVPAPDEGGGRSFDLGGGVEGRVKALEQRAAELQPFLWDQASLFVGLEAQPVGRMGWDFTVAPRLVLGFLTPMLGSRLSPVASVGYTWTRTRRRELDDRVGGYDYVATQHAASLGLGFRIRILPVSKPLSPELGIEPIVELSRKDLDGEIGGVPLGAGYGETAVGFGAIGSVGLAALVHGTGYVTAHIGYTLAPAGGELMGKTSNNGIFGAVGYRQVFRLSR